MKVIIGNNGSKFVNINEIYEEIKNKYNADVYFDIHNNEYFEIVTGYNSYPIFFDLVPFCYDMSSILVKWTDMQTLLEELFEDIVTILYMDVNAFGYSQ